MMVVVRQGFYSIVKSYSNQRSDPEQIMAHDAGTSRLCKECWDVQFATMCCLSMPSSAVIQLLGYSAQEKDSLIRSDNYFITQAGIVLQWHIKSRRSSPSFPVHSYKLDKLKLQIFHQ